MPLPLHLSLAAVPLLIALNAFFVIGEYALVAARPAQLRSLRKRGRLRSANALESLKADSASSIGAIQVCITMTNLLLGWIGEPAMSAVLHRLFGPLIRAWPTTFGSISTLLSFIVVTLLTVVFSELLPKAMTLRYVELAVAVTAIPLLAIQKAIFPLVWLMNKMANVVTRPLGLGRIEEFGGEERVTADDLRHLTTQAAREGGVSARELSLVLNSLAIGNRRAKQIMVPRTRVAYLDLQRSMEENRRVIEQHLFSRLPLCDGGIDHVVGIIRIKEFLEAYYAHGDTPVLSLIAQPAIFMPETIVLERLIEAFHEHHTQMLFLVDEHGGVEGLVTLKDLLDGLLMDNPRP